MAEWRYRSDRGDRLDSFPAWTNIEGTERSGLYFYDHGVSRGAAYFHGDADVAVRYLSRQLHDDLFEPDEVWYRTKILNSEWESLATRNFCLSFDD